MQEFVVLWLEFTAPLCAVIWLAWAAWNWGKRVQLSSLLVPSIVTVVIGGINFLGLLGLWALVSADRSVSFDGLVDELSVSVVDSDNGRTIHLKPGGHLTVALASDPSTGFSWYAGEIAGQELTLEGEPRFAPPRSPPVAGGSGTQSFTFLAADVATRTPGAAATVHLTLEYKRGSDPNAPPAKTFNLTVNIY